MIFLYITITLLLALGAYIGYYAYRAKMICRKAEQILPGLLQKAGLEGKVKIIASSSIRDNIEMAQWLKGGTPALASNRPTGLGVIGAPRIVNNIGGEEKYLIVILGWYFFSKRLINDKGMTWLLSHEIGHIVNGDIDRMTSGEVEVGRNLNFEINADRFAKKFSGIDNELLANIYSDFEKFNIDKSEIQERRKAVLG